MLSIRSQEKIIQRVVKTKTGQFVLATFLVIEHNGELHVKLLSVKSAETKTLSLESKSGSKHENLCLPGQFSKSPKIVCTIKRNDFVSPFFDQLKFFISQPTRAPSSN